MPCDTINRAAAEQARREAQLRELEERIKNGSASVQRNGDLVSVEGWQERGDWCDECAVRRLMQSDDFEVRERVGRLMTIEVNRPITFGHGHDAGFGHDHPHTHNGDGSVTWH